jgi:hypothetical protein
VFQSKKKRALISFESQLKSLSKLDITLRFTWRSQTIDYIKKFIGPESHLIKHFEGMYSVFYDPSDFRDDIKKAESIIISCIESINVNGTYSETKSNFFQKIGDEALVAILLSVFGSGYFLGDYFAKNKADFEKIELKIENDSLKRSLPILFKKSTNLNSRIQGKGKDTTNNKTNK